MIEKILCVWEHTSKVIAVTSLMAMFIINIINIIIRALLNYSFVWVFPMTLFLFIWMTFFGAFVIYRQRKEITVDFIYRLLPEKGKILVTLTCNVLILFLLILILLTAPRLISSQNSLIQILQIPRYFQSFPLFIFCVATFVDFTKEAVSTIKSSKTSS